MAGALPEGRFAEARVRVLTGNTAPTCVVVMTMVVAVMIVAHSASSSESLSPLSITPSLAHSAPACLSPAPPLCLQPCPLERYVRV